MIAYEFLDRNNEPSVAHHSFWRYAAIAGAIASVPITTPMGAIVGAVQGVYLGASAKQDQSLGDVIEDIF
jgi:hypothetical protein